MKKGIESLKAAIMVNTKEGENCFNANGCDHEFTRIVPQDNPKIRAMGFKTACKQIAKCTHKYCDTLKWVMDRAKHYSERTGFTVEQTIEAWEENRTYWYLNYYQDCNQPLSGLKFAKDSSVVINERIEKIELELSDLESEPGIELTDSTLLLISKRIEVLNPELEKLKAKAAYLKVMVFTIPIQETTQQRNDNFLSGIQTLTPGK